MNKKTILITIMILLLCLLSFLVVIAFSENGSLLNVATIVPTPSDNVQETPIVTLAPEPVLTSTPALTPTPEPTATPEPKDPISERIAKLSDKELIGQLVMAGFDGTRTPSKDFIYLMQEYKLSNVILFGWNIQTFSQTQQLVSNTRQYNPVPDIPMFFSTDVEGGMVTRFVRQWKPWPTHAYTLGQKKDTKLAYSNFSMIGKKLKEIGINMDLAPVLDIAKNPLGTFLSKRIISSDPKIASDIAIACIGGLQDNNVVSVGKHYPGHGSTATDSHSSTPVINATLSDWENYEKIPYQAAVDAGIDGILVGHLSYPQIDGSVSSVSHKFITEILREEMGFDGIVMSDDMRMGGISRLYSPGEAAVRFIEAGGDLVLIGRYLNRQTDVLDSINEALINGRLTRERLEESAYRIISKKMQVGE